MRTSDTYYRDHWILADPAQFERWDKMFQWREDLDDKFALANITEGHNVLDFGCGPGHIAVEMGKRVRPRGTVIGVDISEHMIALAKGNAERAGLESRVTFRTLHHDRLPFPDATFDRIICKNVLEYVPDPLATLTELRRTMKRNGVLLVLDSDWGLVLISPWSPSETAKYFRAASHAFKDPFIGRRLHALLNSAGFMQTTLRIFAAPDHDGRLLPMLENMKDYILMRHREKVNAVDMYLKKVEQAMTKGQCLIVLPQFVATAVCP